MKTIIIQETELTADVKGTSIFSIKENDKVICHFSHDIKRGPVVLLKDAAYALLEKEKEKKDEGHY